MAFVAFNKLSNKEFSHLPTKVELTNTQRRAWHAEMKTRLFNHAHSFTKTMVVVDLTNEPVQAMRPSLNGRWLSGKPRPPLHGKTMTASTGKRSSACSSMVVWPISGQALCSKKGTNDYA